MMTVDATMQEESKSHLDTLRERRHRKLYVEMRMPRLQSEIKELAEQKRKLPKDDNTKEATGIRIYANHRIAALREELSQLEEERQAIVTKLKEQRSAEPAQHDEG